MDKRDNLYEEIMQLSKEWQSLSNPQHPQTDRLPIVTAALNLEVPVIAQSQSSDVVMVEHPVATAHPRLSENVKEERHVLVAGSSDDAAAADDDDDDDDVVFVEAKGPPVKTTASNKNPGLSGPKKKRVYGTANRLR